MSADMSEDDQLAWAMAQSLATHEEQSHLTEALAISAAAAPPLQPPPPQPSSSNVLGRAASISAPALPVPPPPPQPPPSASSGSGGNTARSLSTAAFTAVWGNARPENAPTDVARPRIPTTTTIRQHHNPELLAGSHWFVDVAAGTQHLNRLRPASALGPYATQEAALAAARHETPPQWDEHDACMRCSQGFGMLRRRSHCRNCGYSCCKACTKYWPRTAVPQMFTEGDTSGSSSVRVCLSCDAAAQAMRTALLSGDVHAVRAAYADGTRNVNLRCYLPPATEGQPALLLPVHLAAASNSLATLEWLAVEEHCPLVGSASLSLGKPAKSVLRVAIEAQAVDVLQWLIGAEEAPPHLGLPITMPQDTGCAPAAVHRALEAALQDLAAQRRLVQVTIEAALAHGDTALEPPVPSREPSATRRAPVPVPMGESVYPATDVSDGQNPDNECVVCMSAPRDTVLLECRHACVCEQCAGTLAACPLCRATVSSTLRIFT